MKFYGKLNAPRASWTSRSYFSRGRIMDLKPFVSGPPADLACGSKRDVLCTGCVAPYRCQLMGSKHTRACILGGAKLRSLPLAMLKMLPQFSLFSETLRAIAYGFH